MMSKTTEAGLPVGAMLPDVILEGAGGAVSLESLRAGRPLVVVFYTEDATPLCTAALCAFRDDFALVEELGAAFVAISADNVESQRRFGEAQGLPFALLSDTALEAARAFNVVDESGRRSLRAVMVSDRWGVVKASIPYYNPSNSGQYAAVFAALGVGDEGGVTGEREPNEGAS